MTDQANLPLPPTRQTSTPTGEQSVLDEALHPAGERPEPSKASAFGKRILRTVALIIVLVLGGLAWAYITGAPQTAKVGDCLTGDSADEFKTIDCTDPTAQHKVVAKLENKTETEFNENDVETLCAGMPSVENAYWQGEKSGQGFILCLEPVG